MIAQASSVSYVEGYPFSCRSSHLLKGTSRFKSETTSEVICEKVVGKVLRAGQGGWRRSTLRYLPFGRAG